MLLDILYHNQKNFKLYINIYTLIQFRVHPVRNTGCHSTEYALIVLLT